MHFSPSRHELVLEDLLKDGRIGRSSCENAHLCAFYLLPFVHQILFVPSLEIFSNDPHASQAEAAFPGDADFLKYLRGKFCLAATTLFSYPFTALYYVHYSLKSSPAPRGLLLLRFQHLLDVSSVHRSLKSSPDQHSCVSPANSYS